MNLSSLSFFRRLSVDTKQFAIVGLGRFGRAVCATLHEMGYEVLGIDSDQKLVDRVLTDQVVAHALEIDSTDPTALKQAGVFEFDTVIVAIGNYVEESVITVLNLKEAKVRNVVAKASSKIHEKLLKKVGADLVVFPEYEMGCTLARSLTKPSILERLELDPDNSIVEVITPQQFDGKTILELDLRNRYGLTLIAISQSNKLEVNPSATRRLRQGSSMILIGGNRAIEKLPI